MNAKGCAKLELVAKSNISNFHCLPKNNLTPHGLRAVRRRRRRKKLSSYNFFAMLKIFYKHNF